MWVMTSAEALGYYQMPLRGNHLSGADTLRGAKQIQKQAQARKARDWAGLLRPGTGAPRSILAGFAFPVGASNAELVHQFVEGGAADAHFGGGGADLA